MKRLVLAIAFACVLTGVARAGEIHTTGAVPPPPPPPTTTMVTTGETPSADATAPEDSTILLMVLTIIDTIVP